MTTLSILKGLVVTVGLSLGGSALAAGPGPNHGGGGHGQGGPAAVPVVVQDDGIFERRHDEARDRDGRDGWRDEWLDERGQRGDDGFDRFDKNERRIFRLGKQKIADGKALQARGERLLQRARWTHSIRMARQAHALIDKGERLEREGRMLVRRARA